jgi:hypothetical protein
MNNIEILNWLKPPYERDKGRTKKIRENKAIAVLIHIYMEISRGNSLCSYLYLKQQAKNTNFFLFFYYKIRKQDGRTGG